MFKKYVVLASLGAATVAALVAGIFTFQPVPGMVLDPEPNPIETSTSGTSSLVNQDFRTNNEVTDSVSYSNVSNTTAQELEPAVQEIDNPVELKTAIDVAESLEETIFKTMTTQTGVTWGLDLVDGTSDGNYTYINDGAGIRIYIVDTGVDAAHPEFGGRVIDGFDAFGQNLDQTDCNGHGTHVAGIAAGSIFGVSKKATIVPVRVMDCNGVGNTTTLTAGIDWILANHSGGVGIVNMSIGGNKDAEVDAATFRLVSAGLVVVAAAGNSNQDACNFSPAGAQGVVAVAGVDRNQQKASFSNWGTCVDASAPGVRVNSANVDAYNISKQMSGTSQAAPFVAGAIATYLSGDSAMTARQAEFLLNELAQDGVVRVQAEPEEPVEPTPEPVVQPEPVAPEPEPSPSPVADEPILPEYEVSVIEVEDGPMFGMLSWSRVAGSDGYRVYRTSPERPSWKVYGAFTSSSKVQMLIVTDVGKIARYRVVAIIDSKEVEVGEITHSPTE